MSNEIIIIIINIILQTVLVIIHIKNYIINKPKINIELTDKDCDAYYGLVYIKDKPSSTKVGMVEINIINNSPVDIGIRDIRLKIGKSYHRLVDKNNLYWNNVCFYYIDKNNEEIWNDSGFSYRETGISIPANIKSYSILSCICLFHHFPNIEKKQKRCKIVLYTAVGKISKVVRLKKYDETFISSEMKDVELYRKNIINKYK